MSRRCRRRVRLAGTLSLLSVFACSSLATADQGVELAGRVGRVIDGDTVELVAHDGTSISIRLAQIDAPESSQPYGDRSTAALSSIVLGKDVRIVVVDLDRYGRTVGEVYRGDLDVNAEMVRAGHAWAYTRFVKSVEIIDLEDEARREQRGLWTLPPADRDAPWIWREQQRAKRKAVMEPEAFDRTCGAKRTCKEMVSCAEARFYLRECKLRKLDRDGDGVPCESKCRQ